MMNISFINTYTNTVVKLQARLVQDQFADSICWHNYCFNRNNKEDTTCFTSFSRPGGFGTTAFRPQQAQHTHAQETKNRSFPQRVPVVRRTKQPNMFFRDVTDTNQSESHSGHQQLRFTRNYMGAWRTRRRPPTSPLLLDWSCMRTRRRRRRLHLPYRQIKWLKRMFVFINKIKKSEYVIDAFCREAYVSSHRMWLSLVLLLFILQSIKVKTKETCTLVHDLF